MAVRPPSKNSRGPMAPGNAPKAFVKGVDSFMANRPNLERGNGQRDHLAWVKQNQPDYIGTQHRTVRDRLLRRAGLSPKR